VEKVRVKLGRDKISVVLRWVERVLDWVFWGLSMTPFLCLCMWYSFPIRARIALGHWPSYDHPDPKTLGFDIHHGMAVLSLLLFIESFLVFPLVCVIHWRRLGDPETPHWLGVIGFLIAYSVGMILFRTDPWDFGGWVFD
jgi:hypothetical protein